WGAVRAAAAAWSACGLARSYWSEGRPGWDPCGSAAATSCITAGWAAGSGAALAGELLDLVHDAGVHQPPAHALGGGGVDLVDRDRGADADGDGAAVRQQAREHVLGALEADGDHRAAGFEGEPCGA